MTAMAARRRGWLRVAGVTAGSGLQRGLGALLVLVLVAIASRTGEAGDAALVGVAAAIALIALSVADLGSTPAMLRDFATQSPTRTEFFALARVRAFAALIAGLAAAALAVPAGGAWAEAVGIAALSLPLAALVGTATPKLVADRDGLTLGVGAVAGFLLGLAVAAGLAVLDMPAAVLLLALPAARGVEAGILFAGCQFRRRGRQGESSRFDVRWLARAWPLAVYGVLQVVYLRSQVVVPAFVLDRAGAGHVSEGFNLYSAGTLLPGVLALATWPLIVRAQRRYPGRLAATIVRYGAVSLACVLPATAVLLAAPGFVLDLVFGESPASLEAYLRWTAVALLFIGPNTLLLTAIVARDRQRGLAGAWAVASVVAVGANLAFPSLWGVAGAGLAVVVGEALLTVAFALLLAISPARAAAAFHRKVAGRSIGALALAGLGGGVAAGLAAPLIANAVVFPDERTGILALLALPPVLFGVAKVSGYDLFAPASIFALVWSTSLAIAQLPFFPDFNWTPEMWLLVTLPPGIFVASAAIATGSTGFRPAARTRLVGLPTPPPSWILSAMVAFGLLGWAYFYASLGTFPLLSGEIDAVRFTAFPFPALVASRFSHVVVIVCVFLALATTGRARFFFAAIAVAGLVPMLLSGGRLYPVSAVVSGALAAGLVRGLDRRLVVVGVAGFVAIVAASSVLWFARIDQQGPNPFKNYLEGELLHERPAVLQWTIPVQMAASANMLTLGDVVESRALDYDREPGWYSLRFLDRLGPAKDLEIVARDHSRFQQVTTTYLGEFYADFGITGALLYSLVAGGLYGILYRWMRTARSWVPLVLYGYAAFWLVFAVFLGYWATHGVWIIDLPLIVFLGWLMDGRAARSGVRQGVAFAGRSPQASA
ncbi:MAG: oligosaccharide repeat unit polymerase [Dehalococcoidia bacterium]